MIFNGGMSKSQNLCLTYLANNLRIKNRWNIFKKRFCRESYKLSQ